MTVINVCIADQRGKRMALIYRPINRPAALCLFALLAIPVATLATEPASAQDSTRATAPEATAAMQNMQAMHDRMTAAKTPAERQALMADHMKAMQDGMIAMHRMQGVKGSASMSTRMDMMTMMLQMMMDRQQMIGGMGMGGRGGMMRAPNTPTPATPPAPGGSKP